MDLRRLRTSLSHSFVLTDPQSLYHYVGFVTPGTALVALVGAADGTHSLVVRDLEATNAVPRDDVAVVPYAEDDPIAKVAAALQGSTVVGYEADSPQCTVRDFAALRKAVPGVMWVDVSAETQRARAVRTPAQHECVRAAARYVTQAYEAALPHVAPGKTETQIAALLSFGKMSAGSEWTSYPEFVATGRNGLRGHHAASRTTIREGDLLFLEVGASHDRYHAARMHTVCVGTPPAWFAPLREALLEALRIARVECRAHALCSDVDRKMRTVVVAAIEAAGVDAWMQRRSGYSIGASITPDWAAGGVRLNPTSTDRLCVGTTLHVIPWLQIRDVGAMGFSDVLVVGETGGTSVYDASLPSE